MDSKLLTIFIVIAYLVIILTSFLIFSSLTISNNTTSNYEMIIPISASVLPGIVIVFLILRINGIDPGSIEAKLGPFKVALQKNIENVGTKVDESNKKITGLENTVNLIKQDIAIVNKIENIVKSSVNARIDPKFNNTIDLRGIIAEVAELYQVISKNSPGLNPGEQQKAKEVWKKIEKSYTDISPQTNTSNAGNDRVLGDLAYDAGEYEQAKIISDKLLSEFGNDKKFLNKRAMILWKLGEIEAAKEIYLKLEGDDQDEEIKTKVEAIDEFTKIIDSNISKSIEEIQNIDQIEIERIQKKYIRTYDETNQKEIIKFLRKLKQLLAKSNSMFLNQVYVRDQLADSLSDHHKIKRYESFEQMFEKLHGKMNASEKEKFNLIRILTIKLYENNLAIQTVLKNNIKMHVETVSKMGILYEHINGWIKKVENKIQNQNICLIYSDASMKYFPQGIDVDIREKIRWLKQVIYKKEEAIEDEIE